LSPLSRAIDYAVLTLGAAFLALALVFLAARLWFRPLFAAATDADPLVWAAGFGAVSVLLGICHTYRKPHLLYQDPQAYKDRV
jgi:hypothetical protein